MQVAVECKSESNKSSHTQKYMESKRGWTYSFPVKDKLPKIGGIGPTNSFSLKSLQKSDVMQDFDL